MQHNVQREDDNLQNFGRRRLFSRISHASSFTLLEAPKSCSKSGRAHKNGNGESNLKKRGDGMYLLATCPPVLPAAAYHEPRQEYTTGPLCPAQLESQKCS